MPEDSRCLTGLYAKGMTQNNLLGGCSYGRTSTALKLENVVPVLTPLKGLKAKVMVL